MSTSETISIEDALSPPFFKKIPISIERGKGVYVWTERGQGLSISPRAGGLPVSATHIR